MMFSKLAWRPQKDQEQSFSQMGLNEVVPADPIKPQLINGIMRQPKGQQKSHFDTN